MEDVAIRGLVRTWYDKYARSESDPIFRFVILWIGFNAWLAHESGKYADHEMIRWLKTAPPSSSLLRKAYDDARGNTVFNDYLKSLANMRPVTDPRRANSGISIASADDFPHILQAIYQVRCNLFHGSKSPSDPHDLGLVKLCSQILNQWVGNLVGLL